jgi:hypothetical protein
LLSVRGERREAVMQMHQKDSVAGDAELIE